jgi:subtilisin-like proprotein convertase family protein
VPDNTPAGVTDDLVVVDSGEIIDMNVSLDVTHTWVGDLAFTLEHVDTGTTVTFYDRPGVPASTFGCSGNDIAATLDDEAATPVEDECGAGTPTIAGSFMPNNPLSAFDTEDLAGTWRITASDNAGGDTGTLNEWCLLPTYAASGNGTLDGTVTDASTTDPINGAAVNADDGSNTYNASTNPSGDYFISLPPGTYTVTASASGYITATVTGVSIVTDTTTTVDFALLVAEADIVASPGEFVVTQAISSVVTHTLTISNVGTIDLSWAIDEAPGQDTPLVLPASDGSFPRGDAPVSIGQAPVGTVGQLSPATVSEILGSMAFGIETQSVRYTVFDTDTPEILPNVAPAPPTGGFLGAGEYVNGLFYVTDSVTLWEMDPSTGAILNTYSITVPPGGETYSGFAYDPTSGTVYASSTNISASTLFTLDVTTGVATTVGAISGYPCIIAIAADGTGTLYGYDICTDVLVTIDKVTGAGTLVGSIGFDANFGQGMGWDPATDTLYMAAFNNAVFQAELRTVDRVTGNTALVGVLGATDPGALSQVSLLGFEYGGAVGSVCDSPADIPWVSVSPASGTTAPGSSTAVGVAFDTYGLTTGSTYTGTLCLSSNDPDTPLITIPLTLTVEAQSFGVDLSGDQAASTETSVVYTLTVTNTGNIVDTFDLSASGVWTATLSASSVTLGAGESASFTVEVAVPAGVLDGEMDVTTVTATSQNDAAATDSADLTTTAVVPEPDTYQLFLPILLKSE